MTSTGFTGTEDDDTSAVGWSVSDQSVWDSRVGELVHSEDVTATYAGAGGILTGAGMVATLVSIAAYSLVGSFSCIMGSEECQRDVARDRRRISWYIAGGIGVTIAGIGFYAAAAGEGADMDRLAAEMNRMNPVNPMPEPKPGYKPEWIQMEMRMKY